MKAVENGEVILDPTDSHQDHGGLIGFICSKKNDFAMNLGVAFLLLTVIR